MTFKETITTFIIMILIILMTIAFNYEPSIAESNAIELQKDAERLELELKKEAIREKINLQYK